MKENIRMMKSTDEIDENKKDTRENRENAESWKKFFVHNKYKISMIMKTTRKNSGVKVIDYNDVNGIYFLLNEKHIETGTGHSNLPVITNKCDQKYKKCRFDLVDEQKYQPI